MAAAARGVSDLRGGASPCSSAKGDGRARLGRLALGTPARVWCAHVKASLREWEAALGGQPDLWSAPASLSYTTTLCTAALTSWANCRHRLPIKFWMLSASETERVEAAAFRALVAHLRATSDAVSNIDLMGLAGFCRNCLAKWWLRAARSLAAGGKRTPTYEDACVAVYGEPYSTWKRSYQTPATPEQLVGAPARSPISVSGLLCARAGSVRIIEGLAR